MEKQNCNEEHRLFDQVHAECCQCKVARRKVSEALRRVRCWFNKEFRSEELIPKIELVSQTQSPFLADNVVVEPISIVTIKKNNI